MDRVGSRVSRDVALPLGARAVVSLSSAAGPAIPAPLGGQSSRPPVARGCQGGGMVLGGCPCYTGSVPARDGYAGHPDGGHWLQGARPAARHLLSVSFRVATA